VLTDLLRSSDVETRRAAVRAVLHVGTKEAIVPLKYALLDSDRQVRFCAALGLAKVTGQRDWELNMDMFDADEEKYLSHWKDYSEPR